ncbi:MAG: hypothetical protein HS111_28840 [Kofleriaceae bacterium]|nr:hypothetical protein [Kofleriaceae bacterium]
MVGNDLSAGSAVIVGLASQPRSRLEQHEPHDLCSLPGARRRRCPIGTTLTAKWLELWADCEAETPTQCGLVNLHRRYRALVEARLDVPLFEVNLNVRQRAENSSSANIEAQPGLLDNSKRNETVLLWHTCETSGAFTPGGACAPTAP